MIELVRGDILSIEADAAVLSAHPTLVAGSGLSGHFHREAGPDLETAAKVLGPLEPGHSVVTDGYRLNAPRVVHAVAPRYLVGSEQEQATLKQTYMSVFEHSELADCKRIVFPAIGVGIYRWPINLAALIALSALQESPFVETIVCLYDDENFYAYKKLI
jgi:O-acetyl-ADP-ribose deacetylase (regulator of RNase III)